MTDTDSPQTYPVLPLRDIVVFPHMIVPLFVGREKSVRALDEVLAHEGKILSRYQHMRVGSVPVKVGDKVKKGQVIGVMGNTGNCISSRNLPKEYLGTHLHIGIKENSTFYNNGSWVNPVPYLTGQKQIKSSSTPIVTPPSPVPQPAQTVDFKVGDTVEIKLTAQRWASGPIMPARVKGRQYKIQQLGNNNNKLLLGADVKTGENVMSWVYEADVIKI